MCGFTVGGTVASPSLAPTPPAGLVAAPDTQAFGSPLKSGSQHAWQQHPLSGSAVPRTPTAQTQTAKCPEGKGGDDKRCQRGPDPNSKDLFSVTKAAGVGDREARKPNPKL